MMKKRARLGLARVGAAAAAAGEAWVGVGMARVL